MTRISSNFRCLSPFLIRFFGTFLQTFAAMAEEHERTMITKRHTIFANFVSERPKHCQLILRESSTCVLLSVLRGVAIIRCGTVIMCSARMLSADVSLLPDCVPGNS